MNIIASSAHLCTLNMLYALSQSELTTTRRHNLDGLIQLANSHMQCAARYSWKVPRSARQLKARDHDESPGAHSDLEGFGASVEADAAELERLGLTGDCRNPPSRLRFSVS